jgi:hypothetical protein
MLVLMFWGQRTPLARLLIVVGALVVELIALLQFRGYQSRWRGFGFDSSLKTMSAVFSSSR